MAEPQFTEIIGMMMQSNKETVDTYIRDNGVTLTYDEQLAYRKAYGISMDLVQPTMEDLENYVRTHTELESFRTKLSSEEFNEIVMKGLLHQQQEQLLSQTPTSTTPASLESFLTGEDDLSLPLSDNKKDVFHLDTSDSGNLEELEKLMAEGNLPEIIELSQKDGNVYLILDEETGNYRSLDEDAYKKYVESGYNKEVLKNIEGSSSAQVQDGIGIDSIGNFGISEEMDDINHLEETPRESSNGDFLADMALLLEAYSSVLDLKLGFSPYLTALEYSNPTYPGENLSDSKYATAKVSKPNYSSLSGLYAKAKEQASTLESDITDLEQIIDSEIEIFRTEQKEAAELLDMFLLSITMNALDNYLANTDMSTLATEIDELPAEYVQYLIGQMSEEQYNEFIQGVEKYYDNQIASVQYMQGVNVETLGIINNYLNSNDDQNGLRGYDEQISRELNRFYENGYQWNTYEDAAAAGYTNIMTELEFKKRNPNGYYDEYLHEQETKVFLENNSTYIGKQLELEEINLRISENKDLKSLGITTYEQLMNEKNLQEQKQVALREGLLNLTSLKNSAQYDYLPFTKQYSEFSNPNKDWDGEFFSLLDNYLEDNNDRILVLNEVTIQNTDPTSLFADQRNIDTLKEQYFSTEEITKLFGKYGINNYDELMQANAARDLFETSKYEPSFAKTYAYLYNQDPEKASQYKNAIQYKINNIEGQLKAQKFLEGLSPEESKEWFKNTFQVNIQGLKDGVVSFNEGLFHFTEALGMKENRIHSAEEYEKMYILQALSSRGEKEKLGLISDGQNSDELNPYGIIDYTKEYAGKWLDEKYQLSQGIGNMLPSILLGTTLGPLAGSLSLGLSSGGNAYHQSMVEGYSYERSLFYGILTGSTEAITERFLGGLPGLSETKVTDVKSWLVAALKEGNEEVYQDLMDLTFKSLVTGEKIELPESAEELTEFAEGLAKTWSFGAITAGIMQSPSLVKITGKHVNNYLETSFNNMLDFDIDDLENSKAYLITNPTAVSFSEKQVFNLRNVLSSLSSLISNNRANTTTAYSNLIDEKAINLIDKLFISLAEYGVDQGYLNKLYFYRYNGEEYTSKEWKKLVENYAINPSAVKRFANTEYFRIKNYLTTEKGFTNNAASALIKGLDDTGACTYASMANAIFSKYIGKESEFINDFGFDMYIRDEKTGMLKLNSGMLLVDLYSYANIEENGGKLFRNNNGYYELSPEYSRSVVAGRLTMNSKMQEYMSTYDTISPVFISYLKEKGIDIEVEKFNNFILKKSSDNMYNEFAKVIYSLGKNSEGNINTLYSLGIWSSNNPIRMISLDSRVSDTTTANWVDKNGNPSGGHEIFITGARTDGFIVSSWGNSYMIPFSDLKSGLFDISKITFKK